MAIAPYRYTGTDLDCARRRTKWQLRASLTRPGLNHEELVARAADLFAWLATAKLKVTIDREWPLADAARAHEELEGRRTAGKVLLVPSR